MQVHHRTGRGPLLVHRPMQDSFLGGLVAVDEASARRLVRAAVDVRSDQRVLVPDGSAYLETLLELGFVEQRRLVHMRIGELSLSQTRSRLLAQLSYATG